jgi:drug/metabolite transporter (DMT)-like permease
MVGAIVIFSFVDAGAKYLTGSIPPIQLIWGRYASQAVFLTLFAIFTGKRYAFRPAAPRMQVARGVILAVSSMMFITGMSLIPLADAVAISFVSPLFVTLLSIPILKEKVGWRRMAAVTVGFIGVLIIVRPGASTFSPGSLWALLGSLSWSVGFIVTRRLGLSDPVLTTSLISTVAGAITLCFALPFVWVSVSWEIWAMVLLFAAVNLVAQTMLITATTRAEASLLAPFTYVQMIGAVGLGFVIFGTFPDQWTWVGSAIVIASGLYVWRRERIRARERRAGEQRET